MNAWKDVAKSHERLDHALKSYKKVADKEQQRATEAYKKLGLEPRRSILHNFT